LMPRPLASDMQTSEQRTQGVRSKSTSGFQRVNGLRGRGSHSHHSMPVRHKRKVRRPAALPPIMGMTWWGSIDTAGQTPYSN